MKDLGGQLLFDVALEAAEQKRAADLGGYSAQVFLGYPSRAVRDPQDPRTAADIQKIVEAARPTVMYTHNLADKHPTHVALGARVIQALRALPPEMLPEKLYGGAVWRDLDWLPDSEKVVFDCSEWAQLQGDLLGVFDSQIAGGKRYDLAALGRRRANATFFESHQVDRASAVAFAVDLTPLVQDPSLGIRDFVQDSIARFSAEVDRLLADVL